MKKIISLILMLMLVSHEVSWAESASRDFREDTAKLAPPSIFAASNPDEQSKEFKNSILSDMKLLTAAFSIGAHYLVDNRKKETLPRVIRDEFRNDRSFLDGIDLERVSRNNNIISIPYKKRGVGYEIRICSRDRLGSLDKAGSQWAISGRWGIQVLNSDRSYVGDDYASPDYDTTKYILDTRPTEWETAEIIFRDIIPHDRLTSAKILDCAAGKGMVASLAVKSKVKEVVALDHSPNMLKAAREHISGISSPSTVRFVQGDIFDLDEALKNPDGSPEEFDYITIGNALCFFNDQARKEFMTAAMRHLKPDGALIILEGTHYVSKRNKVTFLPQDFEVPEDYQAVMRPYADLLRETGYKDIDIIKGSDEYDEDWGMEIGELKTLVNTNVLVTGRRPARPSWQKVITGINPRMVVFDLDGTLSEQYGEVSDSICGKIERLLEKGIKVLVATGSRWEGRIYEGGPAPTMEKRLWGKIRPELRKNLLVFSDMCNLWGFNDAGLPRLIKSFAMGPELRQKTRRAVDAVIDESGQGGTIEILDKIGGMSARQSGGVETEMTVVELGERSARRMKEERLPALVFASLSSIEIALVSKGAIVEIAKAYFRLGKSDKTLVFGDLMDRLSIDFSMTQVRGAVGMYVGTEDIVLPENVYKIPKSGPAGSEMVLDYLLEYGEPFVRASSSIAAANRIRLDAASREAFLKSIKETDYLLSHWIEEEGIRIEFSKDFGALSIRQGNAIYLDKALAPVHGKISPESKDIIKVIFERYRSQKVSGEVGLIADITGTAAEIISLVKVGRERLYKIRVWFGNWLRANGLTPEGVIFDEVMELTDRLESRGAAFEKIYSKETIMAIAELIQRHYPDFKDGKTPDDIWSTSAVSIQRFMKDLQYRMYNRTDILCRIALENKKKRDEIVELLVGQLLSPTVDDEPGPGEAAKIIEALSIIGGQSGVSGLRKALHHPSSLHVSEKAFHALCRRAKDTKELREIISAYVERLTALSAQDYQIKAFCAFIKELNKENPQAADIGIIKALASLLGGYLHGLNEDQTRMAGGVRGDFPEYVFGAPNIIVSTITALTEEGSAIDKEEAKKTLRDAALAVLSKYIKISTENAVVFNISMSDTGLGELYALPSKVNVCHLHDDGYFINIENARLPKEKAALAVRGVIEKGPQEKSGLVKLDSPNVDAASLGEIADAAEYLVESGVSEKKELTLPGPTREAFSKTHGITIPESVTLGEFIRLSLRGKPIVEPGQARSVQIQDPPAVFSYPTAAGIEPLIERHAVKTTVIGIGAGPGVVSGRAVIAASIDDLPARDEIPYILVCSTGDAAQSELFQDALNRGNLIGLIIITGGKTCHLANLAREANIPCVAGVGREEVLKYNPEITLDGDNGAIDIFSPLRTEERHAQRQSSSGKRIDVTYGNLEEILGDEKLLKELTPAIIKARDAIAGWQAERRLGYRALPDQQEELLRDIESHTNSRIKSGVTDVVLIGIGGQYSTNRTLQDSLRSSLYNSFAKLREGRPRIHMLGNIDPVALDAYLRRNNLDPGTTDICLNSKSGNTIEILTNGYFFVNWLVESLGEEEALKHITILMDDRSPAVGLLGKFFADKEVKRFYIPNTDAQGGDVGGRFSILAPSSLITAAYAGIDIRKLLKGAGDMKSSLRDIEPDGVTRQTVETNKALSMALYVYYNTLKKDKDIFVISSFSEKLRSSADFFKQLFGESLGKDNKGIFPCIATGADTVNELIGSPADKIFLFLNYRPEWVRVPAVTGHPYVNVTIPSLDEYIFGELVFLCEEFTVYLGALLGIDPMVQPKVQLAKAITEENLTGGPAAKRKRIGIELSGEEDLMGASALKRKEVSQTMAYLNKVFPAASRGEAGQGKDEIPPDVQKLVEKNFEMAKEKIGRGVEDLVIIGDRQALLKLRGIYHAVTSPLYDISPRERGALPRVHFVDETKDQMVRELFENLKPARTLVQFIGKREMEHGEDLFTEQLVKRYLHRHIDNVIFPIEAERAVEYEWSRYGLTLSEILSCMMFGLRPEDIIDFMNGYKYYPRPLAEKLAAYSYLLYRGAAGIPKTLNTIFVYADQLAHFNSWVKSRYRSKFARLRHGPTFDTAIGSTDQHSILEPMLNWKNKIFTIFVTVGEFDEDFTIAEGGSYAGALVPPFMRGRSLKELLDAMHAGVSESITDDTRPNVTISIPSLNPRNLGSLFAIFENGSDFEYELLSRDVIVREPSAAEPHRRRTDSSDRTRASASGDEPLRIASVGPRSLERYIGLLGYGFDELGIDHPNITVDAFVPAKNETIADFTTRTKAGGHDVYIVQLHGSDDEEPVAFENFGGRTILLVHRPQEVLLRYSKEEIGRRFKDAAAVVLLGGAMADAYKEIFGDKIRVIPHGFFNLKGATEAKDMDIAVIGSVTGWSDMRWMGDVIKLIKTIREISPSAKAVGYIAGKFYPYKQPTTGVEVNELEELRRDPDCLILSAQEVEEAYNNSEFTGAAAYKKWIYERSGNGKRVIIVDGAFTSEELRSMASSAIDFNTQMYREILNEFKPKVEYSGTLHGEAGGAIPVVFASPSMEDVTRDEGMGMITVPVTFNAAPDAPIEIDYRKAAGEILQLAADPLRYAEICRQNLAAAEKLSMKDIARRYAGLAQTLTQGSVEIDMKIAHEINVEAIPPLERGKTLWHVIPLELIPQSPDFNQCAKFTEFISRLNRSYPKARERIKLVSGRQNLAKIVRELAGDPNNIVDAALSSESQVDEMPDGVKMLVFKRLDPTAGNFSQVEGVLAALRALHIADRGQREEKLSRLYELLTGRLPQKMPDTEDSRRFAREFVFMLPPITVKDVKELKRLNENIEMLIESA